MTSPTEWKEWLARMEESPPAGIPEEIWQRLQVEPTAGRLSDYEMQATLVSLTQEVRLQGRAFKALEESLVPVKTGLEESQKASSQRLQEARRQGEDKLLQALVEAHDRLSLGMDAALLSRQRLSAPRSWWWGGSQQWAAALEVVDSLVEGYRLGLENLEAQLQRSQVTRIQCLGKTFDPHTMNAGAVEETEARPEGEVLEVLRYGYTLRDELFRPAEVRVARRPARKGESARE